MFLDVLIIHSFYPTQGPISGKTPVTVYGEHFVDSPFLACRFDSKDIVSARWIQNGVIECLSPKSAPIIADFEVTNDGQRFIKAKTKFIFVDKVELLSISPLNGAPSGGTEVVVKGLNFVFSPHLYCIFCDKWAPAAYISSSEVRCVTPAMPTGSCAVDVSSNGIDGNGRNLLKFDFLPLPRILRIEPINGPVAGNTEVKVYLADGVENRTICKFGDASPTVPHIVSRGYIICKSPKVTFAKSIFLRISNNGIDLSESFSVFTYIEPILVSSMTPVSGPRRGGTKVIFKGVNFINSKFTSCRFGSVIVPARFVSPMELECLSPENELGDIFVEISNNRQQFSSTRRVFTVYPNSEVFSIYPPTGRALGGTSLSVSGKGFLHLPTLQCVFNNSKRSSAMYVNTSLVKCITPPEDTRLGGGVSVHVSNNGEDLTQSSALFAYINAFEIQSIEPTSGPTLGGTLITIFGQNFVNTTTLYCQFGYTKVIATYVSSDKIKCVSPIANSTDIVSLKIVYNTGSEFLLVPHKFKYYLPEIIYSISPSSVSAELNKTVYVFVTGENFMNTPSLRCKLQGHAPTPAVWVSQSSIRCALETNSRIKPGEYKLLVSNNGVDYRDQSIYFRKRKSMRVLAVQPIYGSHQVGPKFILLRCPSVKWGMYFVVLASTLW